MALTQDEKDDVYLTVSLELMKMFDLLSNLYHKPHLNERSRLIAEIEKNLTEKLENFKLPG